MFTRVLIEAFIVGASAAVVGILISLAMMYYHDINFSVKGYKFWPHVGMSFFLTGALLHLFFEYTGLNKMYCKKGNACLEY